MMQFLRSQNSRVDAFIDTATGKIFYGAKGWSILHEGIKEAEADAAANRLTLDAPALPDEAVHTSRKSAAR